MIGIIETCGRRRKRHTVDAVPHLVSAHAFDCFLLGDTIAAAQSRHPVNLRERAGNNQVGVLFHERNDTLVIRAVCEVEVGFVYENHCFPRSLRDAIAALVLWRDSGSGVVRIANVNQASPRSRKHFRRIMGKSIGQGYLYNFSTVGAGMIDYGFESWVRCDKLTVLRPGEYFRA